MHYITIMLDISLFFRKLYLKVSYKKRELYDDARFPVYLKYLQDEADCDYVAGDLIPFVYHTKIYPCFNAALESDDYWQVYTQFTFHTSGLTIFSKRKHFCNNLQWFMENIIGDGDTRYMSAETIRFCKNWFLKEAKRYGLTKEVKKYSFFAH